MILAEKLVQLFIVAMRDRREQPSLESAGSDPVELGDNAVGLNDDREDIVDLAVLVLAHDLDAISLDRGGALLAVESDTPPCLLRPCLGIVAQHEILGGTAKNDRRRPHFPDQDLVVILLPFVGRAEVEMGF